MTAPRVTAALVRKNLRALGDEKIAQHSARFFKTGKGEYGEGDRFIGVRVPEIRKQVRVFRDARISVAVSLLKSRWHEERLFAVLLLVDQYGRGTQNDKQAVFDAYLAHREYVNNWDIVDSSAHLIVGPHIESGARELLYELAAADTIWDRRIAMMATYHYIRQGDFRDALKVARVLLCDRHDLIHKVVGWMLREIGKRDCDAEEKFLQRHYKKMPRTMLRYAIEKFPETRRKAYLHGSV